MVVESSAESRDEGDKVLFLIRSGVLKVDLYAVKSVVLQQLNGRSDKVGTELGVGNTIEVTWSGDLDISGDGEILGAYRLGSKHIHRS